MSNNSVYGIGLVVYLERQNLTHFLTVNCFNCLLTCSLPVRILAWINSYICLFIIFPFLHGQRRQKIQRASGFNILVSGTKSAAL